MSSGPGRKLPIIFLAPPEGESGADDVSPSVSISPKGTENRSIGMLSTFLLLPSVPLHASSNSRWNSLTLACLCAGFFASAFATTASSCGENFKSFRTLLMGGGGLLTC